MIYDDGVKTDENLRVLECLNCHNTQIAEWDKYCIICGTSLYNLCVGEPILDNFGNYDGPGEQHINPSNARFCAICGAKTIFFDKGLLKSFDKVQISEATEIKHFPQTAEVDNEDEALPF